jgi:hypothetical protein
VTTGHVCSNGVCQVGPGNVGVAFNAQLVATGGVPGSQQCAYYITVTGLPPGLQNANPPCNGDISGTPTKAGTYTVTVTMTPGANGFGQQAGPAGMQQFTIAIGTGRSDRLVLRGAAQEGSSARLNMGCGTDEPIMSFYASDANSSATYTVTQTSTGTLLHTFTGTTEAANGQGSGVAFAVPLSIAGAIVGGYIDAAGHVHGYLLANGTYRAFNDPNAARGTHPHYINAAGDIVGGYIDGSGRIRGFLLHDGRYTTINVP